MTGPRNCIMPSSPATATLPSVARITRICAPGIGKPQGRNSPDALCRLSSVCSVRFQAMPAHDSANPYPARITGRARYDCSARVSCSVTSRMVASPPAKRQRRHERFQSGFSLSKSDCDIRSYRRAWKKLGAKVRETRCRLARSKKRRDAPWPPEPVLRRGA